MPSKRAINHNTWAILIFGVAFVIRLVYLIQIRSNPFFYSPMIDELWNIRWATDILQNSFWGAGAYFRGPLYPYFLALLLKITGSDYFWVRLIQMLIASASVSIAYLLGRQFFSERVARLGSVFYAVYGTLIFYEGMFLIPVIFIFLNLMGLLILARNRDNPRKRPYLLAGLVFGLSAIARPNILLILPFLAIWLFFHFRKKIENKAILVLIIVFFVGVIIPIAPVTVRNYVVADDLILISSQGGINLYLGNNPVTEGLTMMMPEMVLDARIPWDEFNPAVTAYAEQQVGHDLKPSEVSAFWTNRAKQFIFENPGDFLFLTYKKLVYFFSGFENPDQTDIYEFRKYSPLLAVLIFDYGLKFPFGLFAPLALLGIGLSFRRWKSLAPLLIFVIAYIPTVILFLVTARHRLTVVPILLLFAARAAIWLWDAVRQRRYKKLATPAAVILLMLVTLNTNFFELGFRNISQVHYNLALTHSKQGNYEEAAAEFKLAIEETPGVPVLYYGLGTLYNTMGRYREAVAELTRATALDPEYTDAFINLGLAYDALGDDQRAEMSFRKAITLKPDRPEPYINLGDLHLDREEFNLAGQTYLQALDLDPDNHIVYTKLGVLFGRAGDTAKAFSFFRESLAAEPGYAAAYLNWGNICLKSGDTVAAVDRYEQALARDPLAIEPYYNLAVLYIRLGNLDKARQNIEALLKIRPDFAPALDLKKRLDG